MEDVFELTSYFPSFFFFFVTCTFVLRALIDLISQSIFIQPQGPTSLIIFEHLNSANRAPAAMLCNSDGPILAS